MEAVQIAGSSIYATSKGLWLNGIAEELKDQRLIKDLCAQLQPRTRAACGDAVASRARLATKRDRIEGERQRNIDLVIKYVISEEDAKQRIAELEGERLRIEAELAALKEFRFSITLHPAILDRYTIKVNALAEKMAGHAVAEDDRGSLIYNFRALVHGVTVHPKGPRQGFEVEVKGKLAALIGGVVFPQVRYDSGSYVVAGRGRESDPGPESIHPVLVL